MIDLIRYSSYCKENIGEYIGRACLPRPRNTNRTAFSPETARRIIDNTNVPKLCGKKTLDLLNANAERDRIEGLPDDLVAPCLRTLDDFAFGDEVRFKLPGRGRQWEAGRMVGYGDLDVGFDIGSGITCYLPPQYPALFRVDDYNLIKRSGRPTGNLRLYQRCLTALSHQICLGYFTADCDEATAAEITAVLSHGRLNKVPEKPRSR